MKKNFFIIFLFFILFKSWASSFLYTLEGESVSLDIFAKHKRAILFFWNTKCPYCQAEIKRLNNSSLLDKYADIEFFYLDIGESARTINNYINSINLSKKIKDRIFIDRTGHVAQLYDIFGIPTYIFLKDGKIVYRTFYLDEKQIKEIFNE
ncbi:MAG: TlpA family protein disulfide reductase [Candidatus Omnitrophica bacterium]|nr:TlpA family protein disulfide reductase [Candidatus Omnitrophota bacterium]MCM8830995.1 TlpA family protein disulfide reductase [Candidatus Omnitrophota bacterium]